MDEGIFSTYRQGENRVTASILAVLRSLVLSRTEFILGALLDEECTLVTFENQPAKGAKGVPDAEIFAKARILIETKTQRNDLKPDQLERHLKRLGNDDDGRVLVLTPDSSEPSVISEIGDKRLVWAPFASLDEAIRELLREEKEVVSEREEFLLRELQKMLEAEKLLAPAKEVVVVPARMAWAEHQAFHAYVCQPNRPFQQVKYIAFYSNGMIQATVPAIHQIEEQVLFQPGVHQGRLAEIVKRMLDEGRRREGNSHKVFMLSGPQDPQTVKLEQPVRNDLPAAFVQGQRYVSLGALREAKVTSDLVNKSE